VLLNPDGWGLEVVELTRRLIVRQLRRRLIQVANRRRLVHVGLWGRLVVDFRSLRNDTLLRNKKLRRHVAGIRKRRPRDVEVRHFPFPCGKADARRINLASKLPTHSNNHDKLRFGMAWISQGAVYGRPSQLIYPSQMPPRWKTTLAVSRGLLRNCCISRTRNP